MQILEKTELDFSDVLIKPRRSTIASRKDADITREYKFKWCPYTIKGTGIMQANMGTIGNFDVTRKMLKVGLFACLHKHHEVNDLIDFFKSLSDDERKRTFISIGLKDNGVDKLKQLNEEVFGDKDYSMSICIDVPNGYIPQVKQLVIDIRKDYPNCLLMVGNVVTGDIVEDLILSGADIIKAGIGGGGQCITRKQTGVGRPQLSTIIECADAAHQVGGMCCSDGGITCPGDIGKAFGAGADFIMIGSLYAGTTEADGEIVEKTYLTNERTTEVVNYVMGVVNHEKVYETKKFKLFYGMSSSLAQEKFGDGKRKYRASEGRVSLVPYVGSVDDVNEEFLGGLRSTMTYIGATKLKDIPKCCVFYKVNNQLNRTYEGSTIGY